MPLKAARMTYTAFGRVRGYLDTPKGPKASWGILADVSKTHTLVDKCGEFVTPPVWVDGDPWMELDELLVGD